MEDVDVDARTATTTANIDSTPHVHDDLDARSASLAAEDREYWSAHPEIPALVSYFLANGESGSQR